MERFAFKIDKVLKANLYKICRLCGIDNPEKVPILRDEVEEEVVDVDVEPELSQKIRDCIGFVIAKDDKMPQMICSLCVDKINDFHEFREMCFATNIQTRKLLGLKDPVKKNDDIKVEIKSEPMPTIIDRRGRKRKSEDIFVDGEVKTENIKQKAGSIMSLSKKRARLGISLKEDKKLKKYLMPGPNNIKSEIKHELPLETILTIPEGKKKFKEICAICNERFASKYKLDRHKFLSHSPNIPRYVCTTCDETIKKTGEIKSHQLWHKLTKTPYTCALCRERTSSINLYTRHLRDHAQKLATPLIVLDRQCPQCHATFCTNFLYNTHPCAVRTKKCGGCNRLAKNDIEYQRHASICEMAYLKSLIALETVRIKNENDVEAAAESFGLSILDPNTSKVVDNNLNDENVIQTNKLTKKNTKKGISKKDLKRVDDLLKSTMDTLVSIKHEPEMHVDSDIPKYAEHELNKMNDHPEDMDSNAFNDDDFRNIDGYSDDDDQNAAFVPIVQLQTENDVVIKQEPIDSLDQDTNIVTIKKELPDNGYEECSVAGSTAKVPVLKLKITKEHGTLNSSLIDDTSTNREKKKKKKKRKDFDKINDQIDHNENQRSPLSTPNTSPMKSNEQTTMPSPGIIRIKEERIDAEYPDENTVDQSQNSTVHYNTDAIMQPEATVMTSIPMMQFQIACVSSGVDLEKTELQDIKPNRAELDRWLEINSSIEATESSQKGPLEEGCGTEKPSSSNIPKLRQNHNQNIAKTESKSKAFKSTSGISRQVSSTQEIPKIISISSGLDAIAAHNDYNANEHNTPLLNVVVKAEPRDDGYENNSFAEEWMNADPEIESSSPSKDSHHKEIINNDEQAYIDSIDFSNICIKQEKDIDVSESQLTAQIIPSNLYNGAEDIIMESSTSSKVIKEKKNPECTRKIAEDTEDDDEGEDEDAEMEVGEEDDYLEREYRELEWPPPLIEPKTEVIENNSSSIGLVISSVCSEAHQIPDGKHSSLNSIDRLRNSNENDDSDKEIPIKIQPEFNKNSQNPSNNFENNPENDEQTIKKDIPSLKENAIRIRSFTSLKHEKKDSEYSKNEELTSMSLKVVESAENLLETSPSSRSINNESNVRTNLTIENIDEEHQNILNHEVLSNSQIRINNHLSSMESMDQAPNVPPTNNTASDLENCRPSSEESSAEENNTTSAILSNCNEETDNFFNENVDAADQHRCSVALNAQNSSQQRALMLDDNNINEIAENNNNANIERELLDDNSNNSEGVAPSSILEQQTNDDVT